MENEFEKNEAENVTEQLPDPEQIEEETAQAEEEAAQIEEEVSERIAEETAEEVGAEPEKESFTPPYFNNLHYTPREQPVPPYGASADGPTPPHLEGAPGYVPQNGERVSYGVPDVNGGRISYAPAQPVKQPKEPKKKKKSGGKGWIAIVAAVCVLLSFGAGFLGAYVAGVTGSVKAAEGTADNDSPSTVIRQVEPSDVSDKEPSAGSGVYADVVSAVADSVVEVYTEYTTTGWFRYIVSGGGSGVIISEDG